MKIIRKMSFGGVDLELSACLTPEELETAYREQEHNYRIRDAEHQLMDAYDLDPDILSEEELKENEALFLVKTGFSFQEAIDPASDHYLLEEILSQFTDDFDCNRDENSIWQESCRRVVEGRHI